MSSLVVISHYNAWPTDRLVALLDQIAAISAGASFDVCVVVNQAVPEAVRLPERHAGISVLYRENTGYNIGAWEHGRRRNPDHDCYLFLQEECVILRAGWLQAFRRLALRPNVGLVGESLHWAGLGWDKLAEKYRHHPFAALIEGRSVPIPVGIQAGLRRLGIVEGPTGAHLQSLVLCARREVLEAIDGFGLGLTYGDATVMEVATSKKVASLGLKVREVGPGSFRYILHPQWRERQGVLRMLGRTAARWIPVRVQRWIRRHP
ncbi:hypothetical protein [uncultured Sphingomonas sp.]|uniref:hypothetical protein n=1 Tax=uncultured Sphingomonas sp. TaxID=158754 RepID=UPI0035CA5EC5